jgi:hypothetical protein
VVEVFAAVAGAVLGIAASGISGSMRRDQESAVAIARLSSGVEHIAQQLQEFRIDIRRDHALMFERINSVESRVTTLEAKMGIAQPHT